MFFISNKIISSSLVLIRIFPNIAHTDRNKNALTRRIMPSILQHTVRLAAAARPQPAIAITHSRRGFGVLAARASKESDLGECTRFWPHREKFL